MTALVSHRDLNATAGSGVHTAPRWVVLNAAGRAALALTAADVGGICLQLDTATLYWLATSAPVLWKVWPQSASEIANDSSVAGATAKDALNALLAASVANATAIGTNTAGIAANTASIALKANTTYVDGVKPFDPSLYQYYSVRPIVGSAGLAVIAANTGGGTASARTISDADYLSRRMRTAWSTSAAVNNPNTLIVNTAGAVSRRSGFTGVHAFAIEAVGATPRFAFGVIAGAINLGTPGTHVNLIAVGIEEADTNLKLFCNDGSGVATTVVDFGANFPGRTAGACYAFWLNALPVGDVQYRLTRLDQAFTAAGTISANLPDPALQLDSWLASNSGSGGGVCTFCLLNIHVSIPY